MDVDNISACSSDVSMQEVLQEMREGIFTTNGKEFIPEYMKNDHLVQKGESNYSLDLNKFCVAREYILNCRKNTDHGPLSAVRLKYKKLYQDYVKRHGYFGQFGHDAKEFNKNYQAR